MLKRNDVSKHNELLRVSLFTLMIVIIALIFADWKGILVNESGIRWEGLKQFAFYLGIMDLGIILCLTNLVFSKISSTARLTVFIGTLYIATLIIYAGGQFSPLASIVNLFVYTVIFTMTVGAVLACWYCFQTCSFSRHTKSLEIK